MLCLILNFYTYSRSCHRRHTIVQVRTVPLRERVSRLKKQVLREFDSDGLCLLAFEGAAKEFEGGEMRMPIGDQAQGVIRAIREYVEPEVSDEVVARVPEAIKEVSP